MLCFDCSRLSSYRQGINAARMTPHTGSSSNGDDGHVGSVDTKVTNSPGVGDKSGINQLKEMENTMNEMQEKLLSLEKENSEVKLEKRQLALRLQEKDEECNRRLDVENQRLEEKDKELQEMKVKVENLERQLEAQRQARIDDPSSDPLEVLIPPFHTSGERRDGSDICEFCASPKEDSQDWDFHYSNCPDSLKWRGDDTNHSGHYRRMSEVRVREP